LCPSGTKFPSTLQRGQVALVCKAGFQPAHILLLARQSVGGLVRPVSDLRLLLVTDYICGMTDSYAKRLYQEMNGII